MDETAPSSPLDLVKGLFRRANRRRGLVLTVAWIVALACAAIVPLVPQRYEATARVFVDTQSVLKPLMSGLAFQPDLDQQVKMLAQTVITRPNLERMLAQDDMGLNVASPAAREAAVTDMMSRIKLALAEAGLYAISYRDTDPQRAQRVVESTVEMFVRASSGDKMRDSEEASRFIAEQIVIYEAKLTEAENRLKEFKVRNFGVTGLSNQDFFVRMSSVSDQLKQLQADLRAAEQARDAYRRELSGEDPQLPPDAGPGGATAALRLMPTETETAIATQKKHLDELLRRYTDLHPDVASARQYLATLEEQARRERERAADPTKRGAATSPVYQRLRVSLAETEAQVASLRSRVAVDQQRLDELRALAGKVPQVEAEYAQLNRDYEVIRRAYEQLVTRREAASLGLKIDETAQLTNFRVVEPPRVLPRPVFPGHFLLAAGAIALSLLAGLLAPTVADALRPTLEDSRSLREFTRRPVIGMVSNWRSDAEERRLRWRVAAQGLAFTVLVLVQAAWVGWIYVSPAA